MSVLNNFLFFAATVSALAFSASTHAETASKDQIVDIEQRHDIRIAYDVKDDVWEAGVGKALYFMRGLLESYKSMGISDKQLHISIIMHGPAAYWLLNDEAFQTHKNDPFDYNPNEKIVRELLEHGVSVEICNSSMKGNRWTRKDLLPGVTIVHDAYTRLIDLQQQKYAYIRF